MIFFGIMPTMKKIIIGAFLIPQLSFATLGTETNTNYRTSFGKCPSRTAGNLAITLVKEFDRNHSLRDVKKLIVADQLVEKSFLSDYKVNYDPMTKFLKLNFDCPEPLMKVQVYKNSGMDSYDAILVETGQLFDPTYEVLLRNEGKLVEKLPYLALPMGDMDATVQHDMATLIMKMPSEFRKNLSEFILSEKGELTVILSLNGRSSSIFMGKDLWLKKLVKVERIVAFMDGKGQVPVLINLTNDKKPIAKFENKP